MKKELKEFFKTLNLSEEQLDTIIENETLFDEVSNEDLNTIKSENLELQEALKASKQKYRERFLSTDDVIDKKTQPDQEEPEDEEKPTIDDVLNELD